MVGREQKQRGNQQPAPIATLRPKFWARSIVDKGQIPHRALIACTTLAERVPCGTDDPTTGPCGRLWTGAVPDFQGSSSGAGLHLRTHIIDHSKHPIQPPPDCSMVKLCGVRGGGKKKGKKEGKTGKTEGTHRISGAQRRYFILQTANKLSFTKTSKGDLDEGVGKLGRCQDSVESKFLLEIRQGPNVGESNAFPPDFPVTGTNPKSVGCDTPSLALEG